MKSLWDASSSARDPSRAVLALEAASIGAFEHDMLTGALWWSPETYKLFGQDPESFEPTLEGFRRLVNPVDRAREDGRFAECLAQRRHRHSTQFRVRLPDGRERWFANHLGMDYAPDGAPVRAFGIVIDISEAKRIEADLRASHDSFRQIIERAPFGIHAVDTDFRIVLVSEGSKRAFETVSPVLGRDLGDVQRALWPEPFASEATAHFRRVLETGETYRAPATVERRSDTGAVESYDWKVERIHLPDGRMGVVCYFYDLSERQLFERRLRDSEARLQQLADSMPQLVWTADVTGKLDYYNARLAAYGDGQSPAEGWAMRVRVHPDDLAATIEAWAKAMAGDAFYQHEHRLVMADGSARWHLSRARRVTSEDGPPKWFGTSTDIHDMKTTEQALATSIERLQIALDAGRMGTWDLNLVTREMVWNREMYRLLGHDPDAGIVPSYRTWAGRIHPADIERVAKLLNASVEEGTDYHAEYRCLWDDGQLRWLEARGRSARDANGVPVRSYGVLMDITERKLADERQQLLMGELDHRVKNSLALVQAMAQQSFKGEDVPAAARRAFTDRLGAMAAAHSTLTRTRWEGAALADVIAEAIAFCGPAVAHIATSGPAVMLAADKTVPIAMAIHELCTNALKYGALSTESGRVSIGWSIDAASWLTIEWREQGGPPVNSPTRRGFGSLMIERAISHQLRGDSRLLYEPDGVQCTIRMPLQEEGGQ